jgi:fructokinase
VTAPLRIGVDLGGTKIEAVAMGPQGEIVVRRRVATPAQEYDAILAATAALIGAIEAEAGPAAHVGFGTPGAISPATGLMKNSNTLVLNGRPLARDLESALHREIRVENDANCFALSEAVDGAAAGADVVFGVILGTGVGGGIVVDERVLRGRNAVAGEWGHNPLPRMRAEEFPGPRCYCGRDGCIETFLCGPALTRQHRARTGEDSPAPQIARRADEGDAAARATLDVYRDRLARALAHVVNLLDPDVVVLGGGVSNIDAIYDGLEGLVESYAFTDELATKIVKNRHGDSGGVRGAAWLWPAA